MLTLMNSRPLSTRTGLVLGMKSRLLNYKNYLGGCTDSVTRCLIKRSPYFIRLVHKVVVADLTQKRCLPNIRATLIRNPSKRNFKNRPIWLNCVPKIFSRS